MSDSVLKWATPLGFLALLGFIVLLIIYLLKPNYQQKIISTSFVWKMSLKYRKKRVPTSKIRNLLIFICQVLIVCMSTFIIAQPLIVVAQQNEDNERIVIIDAAASMMAQNSSGVSRFDRAKQKILELRQDFDGAITVIVAVDDPYILQNGEDYSTFRSPSSQSAQFVEALNNLKCTYGDSNIDKAMSIAQDIINENPMANIILYSATNCTDYGERVRLERMVDEDEYNAAILDVTATFIEGYYVFAAEVACYSQDRGDLEVFIEVYGANVDDDNPTGTNLVPSNQTVEYDPCVQIARCYNNNSTFVYFSDLNVASYNYLRVSIREEDSLTIDNTYYLYGGTKEVIKVLYSSSLPNIFFNTAIASISKVSKPYWDIVLTQHMPQQNDGFEYSGYDFYIFEHKDIPAELPTDGVVLVASPKSDPDGLGLNVIGNVTSSDGERYLLSTGEIEGEIHPILREVTPSDIAVLQYLAVEEYQGYQPILFTGPTNSDPVLLIKNEPDCKMVFFAFDLNFADMAMTPSFPILMINIFNYFMPYTVNPTTPSKAPNYVYEVGDQVSLNARGEKLEVSYPDGTLLEIDEFSTTITLSAPGRYEFKQELMRGGSPVRDFVFVKMPREQSDFGRTISVRAPYFPKPQSIDWDPLIYLASTLVALLFLERLLQNRELI